MKKILIINQYSANKGDRAVLFSLLKLLELFKDLAVTISTSDPSDWKGQFINENIILVPWGWDYHVNTRSLFTKLKFFILRKIHPITFSFLRTILIRSLPSGWVKPIVNPAFYTAAMNCDLVISTGGHHITTLLAKNAVSSQLFDIACCLILRKKVVLWSQTIGPLDFTSKRDERFVKEILNSLVAIYVREKSSADVLISMGIDSRKVNITYETVISLNESGLCYNPVSSRKNIVGISIYSTVLRNRRELDDYISTISQLADHCAETHKCEIIFIPMELKNSGADDRWLIKQIINKTNHQGKCSVKDNDINTEDHFRLIQECKYFVGHKTHSVIFALAAGTPLVALAYHPKTIEFMKQFGLDEYVIPDQTLQPALLINTFNEMTRNADTIGEKIFKRSKEIGLEIRNDFDAMIHSVLHG